MPSLLAPERDTRRRARLLGPGVLSLVLSLVLHGVLVLVVLFLSLVHINLPPDRRAGHAPSAVSLRPISAGAWARNRGESAQSSADDRTLAERDAPKLPEKKPEQNPVGQVVDVAPGNGEEAEDAKYVASTANKVAKESRAKDQTAFYRNAMPRRTSTAPQQDPGNAPVDRASLAGNLGRGSDDRPLRDARQQKAVLEIPTVKARQEVAVRSTQGPGPGAVVANQAESGAVQGNSQRLRVQQGSSAGGEEGSEGHAGDPNGANLIPSPSVLDKVSGAAANDHLEGVAEGDGTFLNTKEWKYASFFNRVKQSVGMHWDPGHELRQRDPTGNIYGTRDRYTLLNVTLDQGGRVKDVYVEKSCGLDFLDLEAIRSFERAQPFPNPPPGLIATDSTVRFSFGFYLDMGGPRLRLFRQAN